MPPRNSGRTGQRHIAQRVTEREASRQAHREREERAAQTADRLLEALGLDPDAEENEQRVMVDPHTCRLHVHANDIETLLARLST